MIFNNLNKR